MAERQVILINHTLIGEEEVSSSAVRAEILILRDMGPKPTHRLVVKLFDDNSLMLEASDEQGSAKIPVESIAILEQLVEFIKERSVKS